MEKIKLYVNKLFEKQKEPPVECESFTYCPSFQIKDSKHNNKSKYDIENVPYSPRRTYNNPIGRETI